MRVIGVVGLPASGKGEFSRIACEMGVPVVVMGDVIRRKAVEEGIPEDDTGLGGIGNRLRAEHGMDAIARFTIPAVEAAGSPLVVIDGIRGDAEVQAFRARFPEFVLVGIVASFEARLSRLAARGRADDSGQREDLKLRDARERRWGLTRALRQAEHVIKNEGSMAEFEGKVRSLLTRLGAGP
ncbi:MAG: flagellar hook-basal body complex protein FliE [Methanomicrobiales archaeon]|nr:flagellar hook-basal body complex protein FliE [Methanomicrobiales archaeon]